MMRKAQALQLNVPFKQKQNRHQHAMYETYTRTNNPYIIKSILSIIFHKCNIAANINYENSFLQHYCEYLKYVFIFATSLH